MLNNNRFFKKKYNFLLLKDILKITNSTLHKTVNLENKIYDIKNLQNADKDDVSFYNSINYLDKFINTKAGYCFINEKNINKIPNNLIGLVCNDPYLAFAKIVNEFYEVNQFDYSSKNLIHPTAKIGKNSQIAPNAYIGKNVIIGDNCMIGPNSSIMDNVIIGNNCVINANVVISFAEIGDNCAFFNGVKIGQDGFGFAFDNGNNFKIIQIGIVKIGNNVEIGANSCIDRGALEDTIIHDQVKIDNLCQIAHNVEIGFGTVIAGAVSLAGSCKVGKFVQIGGGSNVAGHLYVGDGARIAGMSGVIRDVESKSVMAGIPVMPIKKWHRINLFLQKSIDK
jgi:UDP-3-O-[3-hydroxymyristoyl] glucosamine N-acyltransferase